MAVDALQMKLSQGSLFFPLPFTNATIDNLVQVQNPLPPVPGDPKANVVSFKILSEVQHRYSVRPPVGFIGAGDHITIAFSFNPEQVKAARNPADRELPTEATKDAIHIDFAVVDAASVQLALAHWVPGSKESKLSREVLADASAFWKKRGQVTKNDATMMRFRLRCVFATRNNVPDNLVISVKEEERTRTATEVNAVVPKTRPPPTSTTDPGNTAPPEAPPHRHSDTPKEAPPRIEASLTKRATSLGATPTATVVAATTGTVSAPGAAAALAAKRSSPLPSAVELPSSGGSGVDKKKSIVLAVLNYKLSYAMVAVLLGLTFFCGLWDHNNILTWMIS